MTRQHRGFAEWLGLYVVADLVELRTQWNERVGQTSAKYASHPEVISRWQPHDRKITKVRSALPPGRVVLETLTGVPSAESDAGRTVATTDLPIRDRENSFIERDHKAGTAWIRRGLG